jgi:hypothetical protein
MQLGRYYLYRLRHGVELLQNGMTIGKSGEYYEHVHKQFIEFPSLKIKFPPIEDMKDIKDGKHLFRLGNT